MFEEIQELIESQGGRIIGHIPETGNLQVLITGSPSFEQLEVIMDFLESDTRIISAREMGVFEPPTPVK